MVWIYGAEQCQETVLLGRKKKETEGTCGSYRREVSGDRTVKTTGDVTLPGSAGTEAFCLKVAL